MVANSYIVYYIPWIPCRLEGNRIELGRAKTNRTYTSPDVGLLSDET